MARLDELIAEHRRLIHSMEFAYAMGARRTLGAPDPRLDAVVERVEALQREIAELRAAAGGDAGAAAGRGEGEDASAGETRPD